MNLSTDVNHFLISSSSYHSLISCSSYFAKLQINMWGFAAYLPAHQIWGKCQVHLYLLLRYMSSASQGQKSIAFPYYEKPCASTLPIEIILYWHSSPLAIRVQKAAASFVNGKYATTLDILKLNWLLVNNANGIFLKVHTRVYTCTAWTGQII